nr:DNA starvation/stationary phase protection protein [Actinomycetales bacterium]
MTERFVASEKLRANLQRVLVNLVDLQLQGKQAHWNVTGPGFRSMHRQLDEVVDLARGHADVIAERMRAIQVVPDGTAETVSTTTDLAPYPQGLVSAPDTADATVECLARTVGAVREVFDDVDSEDPASADLLNAIINDFEQQAWMIGSESDEV